MTLLPSTVQHSFLSLLKQGWDQRILGTIGTEPTQGCSQLTMEIARQFKCLFIFKKRGEGGGMP